MEAYGVVESVTRWYKQELKANRITQQQFDERIKKMDEWVDANVGSKKLVTLGVFDD